MSNLVSYFKGLAEDYPHVAGFLVIFALAAFFTASVMVFGWEAVGTMFMMFICGVMLVLFSILIGELISMALDKE